MLADPLLLQAAPAGSLPLREIGIIHCDLKPENILLQNLHSPAIKLIDFGSACHASRPMHTYIQSRFYRSPEVLLGCRYGTPIDIWSMGAIVGELFLGLPLFPGESEYNQMARIVTLRGVPPGKMLDAAPLAQFSRHAEHNPGGTAGSGRWQLKSEAQYCLERGNGTQPCRNKQYFKYRTLPELIRHHRRPSPTRRPRMRTRSTSAAARCSTSLRASCSSSRPIGGRRCKRCAIRSSPASPSLVPSSRRSVRALRPRRVQVAVLVVVARQRVR